MKERVGEEGSKEARWDEETGKEKKGAKKTTEAAVRKWGGGWRETRLGLCFRFYKL